MKAHMIFILITGMDITGIQLLNSSKRLLKFVELETTLEAGSFFLHKNTTYEY
jgi:hypothetical protein